MRHLRNQRGDTLIEVTLALAILGAVLTGAFAAASGAFRLGQTAKERTALVAAGQRQAEALTNFRDSHVWNEFLNGGGAGPTRFNGVSTTSTTGCLASGSCFHMERRQLNGTWQWVPMPGSLAAVADPTIPATGAVSISAERIDANTYKFHVAYANQTLGNSGNGQNTGELLVQLVNLDALR